jgi:hypothetical protein
VAANIAKTAFSMNDVSISSGDGKMDQPNGFFRCAASGPGDSRDADSYLSPGKLYCA